MSNGEGNTSTIVLIIFVCCVISCIFCLLSWSNGDSGSSSGFNLSLLANWKPFQAAYNINSVPEAGNGGDSVYSFNQYVNYGANPSFKLGNPTTGKTIDKCKETCQSTPACKGFTSDNSTCQLYNNVTVLDRTKGSAIYASGDIGAVEYLHTPFGAIPTTSASSLSGTLADTIGKCHSNRQSKDTPCGGFTQSGNSAQMYASIDALDATAAGDTYTDVDHPARFIREGNYNYTDTPSRTWSAPAAWLLAMDGNIPQKPSSNIDAFAMWSSPGFDAGTDSQGSALQASNTIPVTSISNCADACLGNAWCASFTINSAHNSCYMRHDTQPQHFPGRCHSQASADACIPLKGCTQCCCPCGCDGYDAAHDGTYGTDNTSYVKKMYPLDVSCPMSCYQDANCVMSTNDTTTCNEYNTPPTNRTPSTTFKSAWLFDNYPN